MWKHKYYNFKPVTVVTDWLSVSVAKEVMFKKAFPRIYLLSFCISGGKYCCGCIIVYLLMHGRYFVLNSFIVLFSFLTYYVKAKLWRVLTKKWLICLFICLLPFCLSLVSLFFLPPSSRLRLFRNKYNIFFVLYLFGNGAGLLLLPYHWREFVCLLENLCMTESYPFDTFLSLCARFCICDDDDDFQLNWFQCGVIFFLKNQKKTFF